MSKGELLTEEKLSIYDPYGGCLLGLIQLSRHDDPRPLLDIWHAAFIRPEWRCKRCDGTGNELMFMYRACHACGGKGITKGNEHEFPG